MELVDMRDLGSRAFSVWVRVPSGAPRRRKRHIACGDFFQKSPRAHFAASSFQTEPAPDRSGPLRTVPDRAMIGRLRITAEMYVSRGKNS